MMMSHDMLTGTQVTTITLADRGGVKGFHREVFRGLREALEVL